MAVKLQRQIGNHRTILCTLESALLVMLLGRNYWFLVLNCLGRRIDNSTLSGASTELQMYFVGASVNVRLRLQAWESSATWASASCSLLASLCGPHNRSGNMCASSLLHGIEAWDLFQPCTPHAPD